MNAIETVPISSLMLDPANARRHPTKNLEALKASLARFGQQKPVVVDARGRVIAGNGTLTAARALGWSEIRVVRTALEGAEAAAFGVADNRTAELAEWDDDALEIEPRWCDAIVRRYQALTQYQAENLTRPGVRVPMEDGSLFAKPEAAT